MSRLSLVITTSVFLTLLLTVGAFPQDDDMEKEFFEGVAVMEEDYKSFKKAAFEEFQRDVKAMWGDFEVSTKKDWVEYSGDKTGRSRVDFETGKVLVEVVVPEEEVRKNPGILEKKLTEEIKRLVVNKGKSRDYDVPSPALEGKVIKKPLSQKEIPPETLLPEPVLEGQLRDKAGEEVTEKNKEEFAKETVKTKPVVKKELETEKGRMVKAQVTFNLVPHHLRIRAEKYLDTVRANASRFEISVPLAFAVIHTESYFNPKATSHAPAYGLMQLVPRSGARDAFRYVYGKDKLVPPEYLYEPDNNIELGCAYLGLLKAHYFDDIKSPESATYCMVASYNTGAGNLSRAICGEKRLKPAINKANKITSEELYSHLMKNLPYKETQDYLKRVTARMSLYREWEQVK